MSFWVNLSIIIIIIAFLVFFISLHMLQARKEPLKKKEENRRDDFKLPMLIKFLKKRMTDITTKNLYNENLSEEEFKRRTRRRQELKLALKMCNTGDFSSKTYIREYSYELFLKEYGFTEESVNWSIPFDSPHLMTGREKFETLLYLAGKKHGNKGFSYLVDTYGLAEIKPDGRFCITKSDIDHVYKEVVRDRSLQFTDKLKVVTQIVYSHYKGFGIIDELRDMSVDGVSGGVSGVPKRSNGFLSDLEAAKDNEEAQHDGMNSAWCMYRGKSIHLEFLSFETESELRRVVTNIYKYGSPGQLSESRPAIINEQYDGSRVTVFRPKLAESWAFFIRKKFDSQSLQLYDLLTASNNVLAISLLEFLMKGYRTMAITGAQGSGKTTLLLALIQHINPRLNLRIQETSFEANLRSLYPKRNILSFQETDSVTGQEGLDLQKKTDGQVTILGEVATDPVAAWAIQSSQVASLFTLFTHHAKTFRDLVEAIRNSLLKVGMFNNEGIAEQQVVKVLEFDVHMEVDVDGTRYIERITECVPIVYQDEEVTMTALAGGLSAKEHEEVFVKEGTTFFRQQNQRKFYIERTIIKYENGAYVAVEPISATRQAEMLRRMPVEEQESFKAFMNSNWGVQG